MEQRKLTRREKQAVRKEQPEETIKAVTAHKFPGWWSWLPAVLGFILYAQTLNYGFVLDDYSAILENKSTMKGFAGLGEIFSTSYRYGYIFVTDELYRPLTKAIFAICWGISPDNPMPGHFINIILFCLTCFLIYQYLLRWFPGQALMAFAAATLFAAHPIHTEVTANIKSLDEILSLLFGLISLEMYRRYGQEGKTKFLFYAGLISKESTVTFLPVFFLMDWFVLKRSTLKNWKALSVITGVLLLFLLIRYQVLHNERFAQTPPSVVDNALMWQKDRFLRFFAAIAMLGLYLQVLLFPYNLSFDRSFPEVLPKGLSDWETWASLIVCVALFVAGLDALRKRKDYGFAIWFFAFTISLSSNLFFMIGTHYGERLMYTPSLGIIMLAAWGLQGLTGYQINNLVFPTRTWLILAPILVLASVATIFRNTVWESNSALYLSGISTAPNSSRVHYYQGLHLVKPEQLEMVPAASRDSAKKAGINHLLKSVELYPTFSDAWTQLGVTYYRDKKMNEAMAAYNKGLSTNPNDPVLLNNSGTVFFETGNVQEAISRFQRAVNLKPDYAEAWMNLGACYGATGRYNEAIPYLEKAVAADPMLSQAYYYIGITWRNMGNEALAQQFIQKSEQVKSMSGR
jgi:tetratricopeptide (TPR) repeat protein